MHSVVLILLNVCRPGWTMMSRGTRWICDTWLAASLRLTLILFAGLLVLGFWLATGNEHQAVYAESITWVEARFEGIQPISTPHLVEPSLARSTSQAERSSQADLLIAVPGRVAADQDAARLLDSVTTPMLLNHAMTRSHLFTTPTFRIQRAQAETATQVPPAT